MNAKIHEAPYGEQLWRDAATVATDAKKEILKRCRYFQPFVPPTVDGTPWQDIPTDVIISDRRYFVIDPNASWHGFSGLAKEQYALDPCKILLYTPGISLRDGTYEEFGVPGSIVSHYLQEHGMTPEKSDLNSLLFLITPAESPAKLSRLVDLLVRKTPPSPMCCPAWRQPIRIFTARDRFAGCAKNCTIFTKKRTSANYNVSCSRLNIYRRSPCPPPKPRLRSAAIRRARCRFANFRAKSHWKARCRIRRAFSPSSPGNVGRKPPSNTLRFSNARCKPCRDSPPKFRACISANAATARRNCTRMCMKRRPNLPDVQFMIDTKQYSWYTCKACKQAIAKFVKE